MIQTMVKAFWWMTERPLAFAAFAFVLFLLINGTRAALGNARTERVVPVSFGMAAVVGLGTFGSKRLAIARPSR